jgi:hypothetical protein
MTATSGARTMATPPPPCYIFSLISEFTLTYADIQLGAPNYYGGFEAFTTLTFVSCELTLHGSDRL